MIVEAQKCLDLPSEGLRTRRISGVNSNLSPKTGEGWCPGMKTIRQRESWFYFTQPFVPFGPRWIRWDPSHWEGQSALFSLLIQMLILNPYTLTDKFRIIFNQISGYPMTQSGWHRKSSITRSRAILNRGLYVAIPLVCHRRYDEIQQGLDLKFSFPEAPHPI